jgi:hypothetical protein
MKRIPFDLTVSLNNISKSTRTNIIEAFFDKDITIEQISETFGALYVKGYTSGKVLKKLLKLVNGVLEIESVGSTNETIGTVTVNGKEAVPYTKEIMHNSFCEDRSGECLCK